MTRNTVFSPLQPTWLKPLNLVMITEIRYLLTGVPQDRYAGTARQINAQTASHGLGISKKTVELNFIDSPITKAS